MPYCISGLLVRCAHRLGHRSADEPLMRAVKMRISRASAHKIIGCTAIASMRGVPIAATPFSTTTGRRRRRMTCINGDEIGIPQPSPYAMRAMQLMRAATARRPDLSASSISHLGAGEFLRPRALKDAKILIISIPEASSAARVYLMPSYTLGQADHILPGMF